MNAYAADPSLNRLAAAIIAVESGGNAQALGDDGKALGAFQIHAICVQDVNRIYGTEYEHEEVFDPDIARDVFDLYLRHYATERRLDRPVTDEDRARIWNGGPNGWRKPSTLNYWKHVQSHL